MMDVESNGNGKDSDEDSKHFLKSKASRRW